MSLTIRTSSRLCKLCGSKMRLVSLKQGDFDDTEPECSKRGCKDYDTATVSLQRSLAMVYRLDAEVDHDYGEKDD